MKILGISGSLQASSSNMELLRSAAELAPDGIDVDISPTLAALPHFNPDLVVDERSPEAVMGFRALVAAADAVIIATPEYAYGMPGSLKNALDWLVGTGEMYGKRVAVLSAAPSEERGQNARQWTVQTLRAQGADVRASSTVRVHRDGARRRLDDGVPTTLHAVFAALAGPPDGSGTSTSLLQVHADPVGDQ